MSSSRLYFYACCSMKIPNLNFPCTSHKTVSYKVADCMFACYDLNNLQLTAQKYMHLHLLCSQPNHFPSC